MDDRGVVDIDTDSQEFLEHRFETYEQLRTTCPVAYNEAHGGFWLVTGHEEVMTVARDNDTFMHKYEPDAPDGIDYLGICGIPRTEGTPRQGVSEVDGPYHQDLRRALNPFFTPNHIEALRPRMRDMSAWFVDEKIESGAMDLVLDFATPVPAILTLEMMGMPSANWHRYADFFHAATALPRDSPEYTEAVSHWPEMTAELLGFAADRRATPTDDLTSMLVTREVNGHLLDDEAVGDIMWNLVAGGLDTTTSLVGWALYHLGTHRDVRQQVLDNPALLPNAVEEFLRYYSPSETLTRTASRDVELGGRAIKAGDVLMISWVSANHDAKVFDRPDEIVLDRNETKHLAFGFGGHRCIGATLARVEAQVMVGEILARIPDYEIDADQFIPYPGNPLMTGVLQMPATFTPGARSGIARPF